jgi:hypothetical protein
VGRYSSDPAFRLFASQQTAIEEDRTTDHTCQRERMMGDFKPLRRKLGLITLLLACVLLAGWVGSQLRLIGVQTGNSKSTFSVVSMSGRVYFMNLNIPGGFHFTSSDITKPLQPWEGFKDVERAHFAGFEFGVGNHKKAAGVKMGLLILPYWSIVIPLALLSAWLLLSKPRVKNENVPQSEVEVQQRSDAI